MNVAKSSNKEGAALCMDILLANGAALDVKDHAGFTALHYAVMSGNAPAVAKIVAAQPERVLDTDSVSSLRAIDGPCL
jgi:ankyrin repeat protein